MYAGLAEGDLRLRHVSAVYGSTRSRLGEGERRRKSRLSRLSRLSRGGGEIRRGLFELAGRKTLSWTLRAYLLMRERGSSYRLGRTGERMPLLLAGEASRVLGGGDLSRGRGERVYES